jgi:hypothetical protein
MIQNCPPPLAPSASTPAPVAKYLRYSDSGLQSSYARLVAAFRKPKVAGVNIIDEGEADVMARQIVDAVRSMPYSQELQTRARCAFEPVLAASLKATAARALVPAMLLGAVGLAVLGLRKAG